MIRSEKTRQFIIEKTAPIFNKKGYTGTYLSDLTEATGLTKGSIYGNFQNKNEVALEAFRYNYQQVIGQINKKLQSLERADQKLLAFLIFYKEQHQDIFERGGCAILNTAIDADDGNDLLREEVVQAISNWKKKLETILKTGISNNEIQPVDTAKFSNEMIALIEGSVMMAKTLQEPDILIDNITRLESKIHEITI
ncbi:TetR/AcrR family transcriptional regulator [Gracilimonas mengyeensis]|uniref:Transcriptional regulator, TetR family n=1 Tax=Gracilimonas mengyeensis TaxID=1302730 RepID=A0A521DRG0_9BACT|nr:TetR/AcrR family transcriptional regulator [Gracilimonas mengyeensis]SMO74286.1 transcriptional regulator, TetR family [Gracilimonas mengyeensis]